MLPQPSYTSVDEKYTERMIKYGKQSVAALIKQAHTASEVRQKYPYDVYQQWITEALGFSEWMGKKYLAIAQAFPLNELPPTASKSILYVLANESTPPDVRDIVSRAEAQGQPFSVHRLKAIIIERQKSIEDVRAALEAAPSAIRERVANGELAERTALSLSVELVNTSPRVTALALAAKVSDPALIPYLSRMEQSLPLEFGELEVTHALQGSGVAITLDKAVVNDIRAVYSESRREQGIIEWEKKRPKRFVETPAVIVERRGNRLVIECADLPPDSLPSDVFLILQEKRKG